MASVVSSTGCTGGYAYSALRAVRDRYRKTGKDIDDVEEEVNIYQFKKHYPIVAGFFFTK